MGTNSKDHINQNKNVMLSAICQQSLSKVGIIRNQKGSKICQKRKVTQHGSPHICKSNCNKLTLTKRLFSRNVLIILGLMLLQLHDAFKWLTLLDLSSNTTIFVVVVVVVVVVFNRIGKMCFYISMALLKWCTG